MPTTGCKPLCPFGVQIDKKIASQEIRSLMAKHDLIVIKQADFKKADDLIEFAAGLSLQSGPLENQLLHWDFGPLMTMKFDVDAKNYLFSAEEVPLHWDGAFHKEPRYLLFFCEESHGAGGETVFCHTPSVLQEFSEQQRRQMKSIRLRYKTEKLAHYGGEIQVPLLQKHPMSKKDILRFAEEVESSLNPVELSVTGDKHSLLDNVKEATSSNRHRYTHSWEPGDLLIADNFSLVHGRKPLGKNTKRRFSRLQIL